MISQRSVQGLPVKVDIPDDFNCPICLHSKSQTAAHHPRNSLVLNIKGAHFHMDFGFFNVPSICGFQSFLVIAEAVTSYTWVFLHRNKTPPSLYGYGFVSTSPRRTLYLLSLGALIMVEDSGAVQNIELLLHLNIV
jgi:hypothetical protein